MEAILAILGGYLLGSIPTGYLLAKSRGVDIRSVGSGSIGATNVSRGLGRGAGLFVLMVDVAKGLVAVTVVPSVAVLHPHADFSRPDSPDFWLVPLAGVGAVVGHNFPVWLKFCGGKGVATSLGIFLYLAFLPTLGVLCVWIIVFALFRYVSLASILAGVSLPIWIYVSPIHSTPSLLFASVFLPVLLIIRHQSNIKRLLAGMEPKFSFKKKDGSLTESKV